MGKKRKSSVPKFNAAAAFAAAPDDDSMGQSGAADPSQSAAPADPSQSSDPSSAGGDQSSVASGQPVSFAPEQVAQMEQFKQQQDYQSLGQYVAQYLP